MNWEKLENLNILLRKSIITSTYVLTILEAIRQISNLCISLRESPVPSHSPQEKFLPSFRKSTIQPMGLLLRNSPAAREMKFLWKLEKPMTGLILIASSWTRAFPSLTHSIVYQLYLDRIRERNKENNLIFIDIIFFFIAPKKNVNQFFYLHFNTVQETG